MDPISNVDQLVLILRQRLEARQRAAVKGPRPHKPEQSASRRAEFLQAIAGAEGVPDKQMRRALIQQLLTDSFGRGMLNDAKFQQVVDRVMGAIEADEVASEVLASVIAELRAGAVK